MEKEKNPAAVALGRLGGKKGGPARMALLDDAGKSELGRKAAKARWDRYRAEKAAEEGGAEQARRLAVIGSQDRKP
ncbi:MAG: hypothetical protein V3T65_06730 [Acidobacteriota bacterium]